MKNLYKISAGHYLQENGQALEELNIVDMVCYNPSFYFRQHNCQLWTIFVSCKYPSKKRNFILLDKGKMLFFYIYMYSSQFIRKKNSWFQTLFILEFIWRSYNIVVFPKCTSCSNRIVHHTCQHPIALCLIIPIDILIVYVTKIRYN